MMLLFTLFIGFNCRISPQKITRNVIGLSFTPWFWHGGFHITHTVAWPGFNMHDLQPKSSDIHFKEALNLSIKLSEHKTRP